MKGLILAATMLLTALTALAATEPAAQNDNVLEHIVASPAAPVQLSAESMPAEPPMWQDCNVGTIFTDDEVNALAQLVYGEACNCDIEGQAAVVWCVLNRMDDERYPDTALEVVTQQNQFFGYHKDNPVLPEIVRLVEDVLKRYNEEQSGIESVGRVLPKEYVFFSGDSEQNYFTVTYAARDVWDWSLWSPYKEIEEVRNGGFYIS